MTTRSASIGLLLFACSAAPNRAFDAGNDVGSDPADASLAARKPIFVALGSVGRTTVSCDDGATWTANRSEDDTLRCGGGVDCDHDARVAHGFAIAGEWFVANFGHGLAGTIRRSRDGVTWTTVDTGKAYAAMAVRGHELLAANNIPLRSMDDGATWLPGSKPFSTAATFRHGLSTGTGFLVLADGPRAAFSVDAVAWTARELPPICDAPGGAVMGGGVVLVPGTTGVVCRSSDDGASWKTTTLPGTPRTLIWTGSEFRGYAATAVYRSPDGATWTDVPLVRRVGAVVQPTPPNLAVVTVAPHGTFVGMTPAISSYEKQRFYRSADGITWDELAEGAFSKSHPIKEVGWGQADASACSP